MAVLACFDPRGLIWKQKGVRRSLRPPQFSSGLLWKAGRSLIASSSRWNSATINSNRLRISVSIIAAAKRLARVRAGNPNLLIKTAHNARNVFVTEVGPAAGPLLLGIASSHALLSGVSHVKPHSTANCGPRYARCS
jgi:hypothetical protein